MLPGLFNVLAIETPRTAALADAFASPHAGSVVVSSDGRLEQLGWPLERDLAVARTAFARIAPAHPLTAQALGDAQAVAGGAILDPDLLQRRWATSLVLELAAGGAAVPDAIEVARPIVGELAEPDRQLVETHAAWAAEHRATVSAMQQLRVAINAVDSGWTAYNAHRRLPSFAAQAAARVVRAAIAEVGEELVGELVELALSLVRTRRRVLIATRTEDVALADEIAAEVRARDHDASLVTGRLPTGDSCVPFCRRLLDDGPDAIVVVRSDAGGVFVTRELATALRMSRRRNVRVVEIPADDPGPALAVLYAAL